MSFLDIHSNSAAFNMTHENERMTAASKFSDNKKPEHIIISMCSGFQKTLLEWFLVEGAGSRTIVWARSAWVYEGLPTCDPHRFFNQKPSNRDTPFESACNGTAST